VWHTGRRVEVRHIQIAPCGDGWTVGEASLDNAQFFQRRSHAEAAALDMGERLTDAGEPSRISIYLGNGASGGHFIVTSEAVEARKA
jgi:hypothetical protein